MCENSLDKLIQQQNSDAVEDSASEEIRKKYLNHEASVKSIGLLGILGAFLLIIAGVIGAVCNDESPLAARIFIAMLFISLRSLSTLGWDESASTQAMGKDSSRHFARYRVAWISYRYYYQ